MAHEVENIPCEAGKSVFDARIQRILSITAAYYGLESEQGANLSAGGPQA
jgi:hypothetical protein